MFGATKNRECINPKIQQDASTCTLTTMNKERLGATFELKKQIDASDQRHKENEINLTNIRKSLEVLQQTIDEKLISMKNDMNDAIAKIERTIKDTQADLVTLNDLNEEALKEIELKVDSKIDCVYSSIEDYIANTSTSITPRSSADITDIKSKVNDFESKLATLEKTISVSAIKPEAKPELPIERKVKLMRPPTSK
jgi:hypothetical protein